MEKEIRIPVPEGMEIDRENSTFECIKFKPIEKKRWRDDKDAKISVYSNTLFKIATILSQYEDKDDSPLEKIRSIMIDGTICSMDLESKKKERDEQKPTDEEMKILLQTEYEKGKADAIEQKSAWSEDDEEMFDAIIADIQFTQKAHNHEVNQVVYEREIDWLKSLKDRVKLQLNQEWSQVDEIGLGDALCAIKQARTIAKDENDMGNIWYAEKWLKSIKDRVQPQWKPSEEQMDNLSRAFNGATYQVSLLRKLYQDLKKLMEE